MSKQYLLTIIGLVVVVLGIFGYKMLGNESSEDTVLTGNGKTEQSQYTKGSATMKGLLASVVPQKCTFQSAVENSQSSGTVYFSGGKMRGDFSSVTSAGVVPSHMVLKDKVNYVWTDNEKMGIKIAVSDAPATGEGTKTGREVADLDQNVDVDCSAWLPDQSMFELPEDVTFNDMNEMMQQMMLKAPVGGQMETGVIPSDVKKGTPSMNDMKSVQCGACDSAGEARAQCRLALKCD